MIAAIDAINAINDVRGDAVVVTTMTPARYWKHVTTRPELDLPVYGGMGKASSLALGLAIARPDKKVIVLDGDGSLLMNLGSLVTIGNQIPPNLLHVVFEDGVYFTTGGQPLPGADIVDFVAIARAAGIMNSVGFNDLEDFSAELPGLIERSASTFVSLKIYHYDDAPGLDVQSTSDAVKGLRQILMA
jgi:sulfopyruvate decarboxylase subunit beta